MAPRCVYCDMFCPLLACCLLQRVVEGRVKEGERCVIVEDVVTTGGSVLETAIALRAVGLHVDTAVVLLNREQGGKENLSRHGITLISALSVHEMLESLHKQGCISQDKVHLITDFLLENRPQLPQTQVSMLVDRCPVYISSH